MSFCIDNDKLLEAYKIIKTISTSFPSLNVTEDAAECVIKKMTKICAHFKIETDATHNLIDDFFSNFVCHRTFP